MKDILNTKEFRSKLKDKKIHNYIKNNTLMVEDIINDFSNYIYTIVKNSYILLSDEDIEEIVMDVVFTIWKNREKLDINKNMSPYIAGITKNIIKKKYRDIKTIDNIQDYEEKLIDFNSIELQFSQKEQNHTILKYIENLKDEDRNIFIKYYYEENDIKTISKYFNITESKAKSKLFRIRKKMKKYLIKEGII